MFIAQARSYQEVGLNVLPLIPGTKRPACQWEQYQRSFYDGPSDAFSGGLGVVSGAVSGGLVILDVDGGESAMVEYGDNLRQLKPDIFDNVLIERSPSKGFHLAYRCPILPAYPPKVWKRGGKTILEMRGDNQFTVIYPTPRYELLMGSWLNLPILSPMEHELVCSVANRMGESPVHRTGDDKATREERPKDAGGRTGDILGPSGQESLYLIEEDAPRLMLKSLGCDFVALKVCRSNCFGQAGRPEEYWRRPGKDDDSHGITYFPEKGITYCFSTNAEPLLYKHGYTALDLFSTVVMDEPISMVDGSSSIRRNAIRNASLAIRKGEWVRWKSEKEKELLVTR